MSRTPVRTRIAALVVALGVGAAAFVATADPQDSTWDGVHAHPVSAASAPADSGPDDSTWD